MPGKIIPVHHTLADWDFQHGAENRSLSADYFISPPTSLKFVSGNGTWLSTVLCRIPATLCLPQGELRTWNRSLLGGFYPAVFRNQAALGTADPKNCYILYATAGRIYLFRIIDEASVNVDNTVCTTYLDQWMHHRSFWYNGFTPGEVPALCVDFYQEIAGEWVKEGDTLYDTMNKWADSEINRCGFRDYLVGANNSYRDDTEIWGPV